ncbi:unnamed protein product [Arabidopsis arenosa]|uniref:Uncharacterized protein n=1 Tax=Arabidopsis arenosa TaxID=38785 RepID=A0A8S1ZPN1_ARAAE|nr:unnamed protein product [Arabidopsis arenosa]
MEDSCERVREKQVNLGGKKVKTSETHSCESFNSMEDSFDRGEAKRLNFGGKKVKTSETHICESFNSMEDDLDDRGEAKMLNRGGTQVKASETHSCESFNSMEDDLGKDKMLNRGGTQVKASETHSCESFNSMEDDLDYKGQYKSLYLATEVQHKWNNLPEHLFDFISEKVDLVTNMNAKVVCKAWKSTKRQTPKTPSILTMKGGSGKMKVYEYADTGNGKRKFQGVGQNCLKGYQLVGSADSKVLVHQIETRIVKFYNPVTGRSQKLPNLPPATIPLLCSYSDEKNDMKRQLFILCEIGKKCMCVLQLEINRWKQINIKTNFKPKYLDGFFHLDRNLYLTEGNYMGKVDLTKVWVPADREFNTAVKRLDLKDSGSGFSLGLPKNAFMKINATIMKGEFRGCVAFKNGTGRRKMRAAWFYPAV